MSRDPSVSVGASDEALLLISFVGFIGVFLAFYLLVYRPAAQDGKENAGGDERRRGNPPTTDDYYEELDAADVGTLNRAQRRARAKNRMKKNRRIVREEAEEGVAAATAGAAGDGGVDGRDEAPANGVAAGPEGANAAEGGDGVASAAASASVRPLTRKERARAAKAAEREELRRYKEQRRQELRVNLEAEEAAYRESTPTEREEAATAELEMDRLRNEKKDREKEEDDEWRTMFSVDADGERTALTVSVQEFIDYVRAQKVVVLNEIAAQFHVTTNIVLERLRKLEDAGWITGIIDDQGKFINISPEEMRSVADFINERGRVTLSDLSEESTRLLTLHDGGKGQEKCAPLVLDNSQI